jgi:hypothetical protein
MKKMINELAQIRAEMAELKKRDSELSAQIKAAGVGTYEGDEHYVVVSESTRETLDMKAVRAKLSRQFMKSHTKVSTSTQIRLFGYSKKAVA